MIIQCPSCSTKFAVESAQLSDVENPRFHCSRCDHFFELASAVPAPETFEAAPDSDGDSRSAYQLDLLGSPKPKISASSPEIERQLGTSVSPVMTESELGGSNVLSSTSFSSLGETAESELGGELDADLGRALDDERSVADDETAGIGSVYADWPDGNSAQLFEADYSSLHNKLYATPLREATERRAAENQNPEQASAEHRRTGVTGTAECLDSPPARAFEVSPFRSLDEDDDELVSLEQYDLDTSAEESSGADDDELPTFERALRDETNSSAAAASPASSPESFPKSYSQLSASSTAKPVVSKIVDSDVDSVQIRSGDTGRFQLSSFRDAEPFEDSRPGAAKATDGQRERAPRENATREVPALRRRSKIEMRGRKPLALPLAASVPLLMAAGMWFWSGHLTMTPAALKDLLLLEPSGLPQVPPQGLEVVDLTSSLVTLDDGERVLEIRGNILNATMRAFGKVKLEARIFDQSNRELSRMLVDSHSSLSDAKIEALSADALMNMQGQSSSSFVRLNPNERVPFRIVFAKVPDGTNVQEIQWYSTRIYSTEAL